MRRLLPAIVLLGAAAILSPSVSRSDAPQDVVPRPVIWMTATPERAGTLSFAGVIQPRVETELAFRTLGRVIARKVEAGDVVKKGDVLALIDPLALQLAVTGAQAELRNASAQLENATITERRKRVLVSTNSASSADLELAEQGLKSAQANMTKAEANLAKAREQLGYAELKAEFDGVITSTSVEVGQTTTASQAVLKLARLDQRDVVIDVSEGQLAQIRSANRVDVALQLDGRLRTSGSIREIAPQADAETRTHRVKIAVDEAPAVFRFGSVVTAAFSNGAGDSAIVLPRSAITFRDGAADVWVIDEATLTVSRRPVGLEASEAGSSQVRVNRGLDTGEKVVVAGGDQLQEGQKTRLGQEMHR